MNFPEQIKTQLACLDAQFSDLDNPHPLVCQSRDGRLTVEVLAKDLLACNLRAIVASIPSTENWEAKQIQQASEELSSRLVYLLEPLAAIEFDQDAAILQMRSNPPTEDEQTGRSYYELLFRPGTCTLRRFQKQNGQPREQIAMAFTHEVLARLVGDFEATVFRV